MDNHCGQPQRPEQQSPALLIDASIYIFRYYFSLPDNWFSREGYATAAVYGYTTFLLQLLELKPPVIAACFDESLSTCFRNKLYPDYKSSRALPDEALAFQLKSCRKVSELLGIACYSSKTYEADDLIGTLITRLRRSKRPVAIVSRDKDLGQLLIREQDFLWDYAGDQRYYFDDIENKFGVKPTQLVDYLALVGDSSDDIPGVPGIGIKTAVTLLQHFDSIENLFANADRLAELPLRGAKSIAVKLTEYQHQIAMAQQLAKIVCNIPLKANVSLLKPKPVDEKKLQRFFRQMGFGENLMKRTKTVLSL